MKYYNVIDKNGKVLFEGEFEKLTPFLSSKNIPLLKVESNEKEKLIDLSGSKIFDEEYDKISNLEIGETINYYIVNNKDKFGYIREDGSKITEIIYNELPSYHNRNFKNGLAFVVENGKKKFIKEDGTDFIEIETACGYGFDNGVALLQKNRLYGYINTDGNEITGFIYHDATRFTKQGHGIVSKNGKWGIINFKGVVILDFKFDQIDYLTTFSKNESIKQILKVKSNNLYGFIDLEKNIYSECDCKEIKYIDDSHLLIKKEKSWGLVDFNNKEIVPCNYDEIRKLNDFIFCKKGKKIEVTNLKNKEQVTYKCESFYLFKDAYIIKNKENYLIFEFESSNIFELAIDKLDDISNYNAGKIIGVLNNRYGIIDVKGKVCIDFIYNQIKLQFDESKSSIYIVSKDGLWGTIDANNQMIIEIKYENILLRHNVFMAKSNKLEEIIDINGKNINDIKYEYLTDWVLDNQLFIVGYYHKGMKVSKSTYVIDRETKSSKECRIIILSKSADDYLYIVAIGYVGGGIWGEIIAKIDTTNNWDTSKGVFTNNLHDKNWKFKYDGDICEETSEAINEIDSSIIKELEEELFSKYIYYNDDDDSVADIPLLNKEFKASLKSKTFDSNRSTSIYKNLSKHWGLSYKW